MCRASHLAQNTRKRVLYGYGCPFAILLAVGLVLGGLAAALRLWPPPPNPCPANGANFSACLSHACCATDGTSCFLASGGLGTFGCSYACSQYCPGQALDPTGLGFYASTIAAGLCLVTAIPFMLLLCFCVHPCCKQTAEDECGDGARCGLCCCPVA
jgi:hypothetical protein